MELEFRARDYRGEESAAELRRSPAINHPLSPLSLSSHQICRIDSEKVEFDDPLRAHTENVTELEGLPSDSSSGKRNSNEAGCLSTKEWIVFKSTLLQKFSCNNKIPISQTLDILVRNRGYGKSLADVHMEELDDPEIISKEEKKVVTRQEYVKRLHELKFEILETWRSDERIKALKLSTKVARLLSDTTVSQFYPTLFILVVEVLDMLGDLVWDRIMRKAGCSGDGIPLHSLLDSFLSGDICSEAKDTCYNWFCKIGSIRELLPRIYLELSILRCWRFLEDNHFHNLHRLTMMIRGLADPLASAYCHLYLTHCAESLYPEDRGYLIKSMNDITLQMEQTIVNKDKVSNQFYSKKMLVTLMEPAIEWIMKCIFNYGNNKKLDTILAELGLIPTLSKSTREIPCISIVLHHLIKQVPAEFISTNALEILMLFEQHNDISLDQHLNYRLLGLRLCESPPPLSSVRDVLNQIIKVVNQYNCLDGYLLVTDAYIDVILHYSMYDYLSTILNGILQRIQSNMDHENDGDILQSNLVKIVNHFNGLEDIFSLNHFVEILEILRGSSSNTVNMQILLKAIRIGFNSDPKTIQFLFETSRTLHDSIDISVIDSDQQKACLISTFIQRVDFGAEKERHLSFLIECRATFGHFGWLKDTLVHLSNNLGLKAIKSMNKFVSFLKACVAFSEVTIPSISSNRRRMNLYIETAEVALLGGLIPHTEGLLSSAVSCLQLLDVTTGFQKSVEIDEFVSLSCKLCSMLVMIPGIHGEGTTFLPGKLLSESNHQSLPSSKLKAKILCAIISLSASLSQKKLPYCVSSLKAVSSDQMFYGDALYHEKVSSLSSNTVEKLVCVIEEEPHLVTRGNLALDACNCLVISFKANRQLRLTCSRLLDVAKASLHPQNKYLESTMIFFDKNFSQDSHL